MMSFYRGKVYEILNAIYNPEINVDSFLNQEYINEYAKQYKKNTIIRFRKKLQQGKKDEPVWTEGKIIDIYPNYLVVGVIRQKAKCKEIIYRTTILFKDILIGEIIVRSDKNGRKKRR